MVKNNDKMLHLVFIIIIVIFIVYLLIVILYNTQITEDIKIYIYKKTDFPLNIYFYDKTMSHPSFQRLYHSIRHAVVRFNDAANFQFFTITDNITKYPNVVMVQIACGSHYGCISKFDGKGGILAHATYPPNRKLCIDCKDIDHEPLYIILMHELGHIIGLRHTKIHVKSVMNAYIDDSLEGFTKYDVMCIKRMFKFLK